jgi:predicted flap endonuclease-1-like 5' DNA nuclease
MAEVQYRNTEIDVPHTNVSKPLFALGILAGLVGIALFELAVHDVSVSGGETTSYGLFEAGYVLALLTAPLLFYSFVWAVRSSSAALILGTLGLLVSFTGIALFSYYYPNQINVWDTDQTDQTILVMNVYLVGFLLLLVGIYVGHKEQARRLRSIERTLATPPTMEAPAPEVVVAAPTAEPMGQTLDVYELEGVRRPEARRLRAVGIHHTGQLLAVDADDVSRRTGIEAGRLRVWQSMADLVRVNGIGPQFAALLYQAGVHDVAHLAKETPESLKDRVKNYLNSARRPPTRVPVDDGRARAWIDEAQRLKAGLPPQTNANVVTTTPPPIAAAQ